MSILSFMGCAGPSFTWETNTRSDISPTFNPQVLTQEPVAIFPTMTTSIQTGFRSGLSGSLHEVVRESTPTMESISHQDTLSQINRLGVAAEYVEMVKDWGSSGILDQQRLNIIGEALGAKFVLIPGLADLTSSLEDRFALQGLRLLQTRTVTLRLSLQIWKVETGEILYESFGGGTMAHEVFTQRQGLVMSLAKKLWWSMIEDLIHGRTESHYRGMGRTEMQSENNKAD